MRPIFLIMTLTLVLLIHPSTSSNGKFREECTEDKEDRVETSPGSGNFTVTITKDNCESSLFLKCQSGRCACKDPINHVFGVKSVLKVKDRSKRSPEPGKKKGISTGKAVIGGIAAGAIGYQVGKAVHGGGGSNGGGGGDGGSGGGGGGSTFGFHRDEYIKVRSCYGIIGAECAVNPDKTTLIQKITVVDGNSTTVQSSVDYHGYPSCIQNAICVEKKGKAQGADPNFGECACKSGFKVSKIGECEKSGAGSSGMKAGGFGIMTMMTFALTLYYTLVGSKMDC